MVETGLLGELERGEGVLEQRVSYRREEGGDLLDTGVDRTYYHRH